MWWQVLKTISSNVIPRPFTDWLSSHLRSPSGAGEESAAWWMSLNLLSFENWRCIIIFLDVGWYTSFHNRLSKRQDRWCKPNVHTQAFAAWRGPCPTFPFFATLAPCIDKVWLHWFLLFFDFTRLQAIVCLWGFCCFLASYKEHCCTGTCMTAQPGTWKIDEISSPGAMCYSMSLQISDSDFFFSSESSHLDAGIIIGFLKQCKKPQELCVAIVLNLKCYKQPWNISPLKVQPCWLWDGVVWTSAFASCKHNEAKRLTKSDCFWTILLWED